MHCFRSPCSGCWPQRWGVSTGMRAAKDRWAQHLPTLLMYFSREISVDVCYERFQRVSLGTPYQHVFWPTLRRVQYCTYRVHCSSPHSISDSVNSGRTISKLLSNFRSPADFNGVCWSKAYSYVFNTGLHVLSVFNRVLQPVLFPGFRHCGYKKTFNSVL